MICAETTSTATGSGEPGDEVLLVMFDLGRFEPRPSHQISAGSALRWITKVKRRSQYKYQTRRKHDTKSHHNNCDCVISGNLEHREPPKIADGPAWSTLLMRRRIADLYRGVHFPAPLLAVPTRFCIASGTMGQGSASLLSLESEKAAAEPVRLGFGSMGDTIIPSVRSRAPEPKIIESSIAQCDCAYIVLEVTFQKRGGSR